MSEHDVGRDRDLKHRKGAGQMENEWLRSSPVKCLLCKHEGLNFNPHREFHLQNPHRKLGCDGMHQESQAWGSGTKRIGISVAWGLDLCGSPSSWLTLIGKPSPVTDTVSKNKIGSSWGGIHMCLHRENKRERETYLTYQNRNMIKDFTSSAH